MKIAKIASVLLISSLMLWGCSKGNTNAPPAIDPKTGKHVIPTWKNGDVHGGVDFGASRDMASCQECHGKDFAGGISKVSCIQNSANCHGAVNSPHPPRPWRGGPITHTLVKESTIETCAICHTKGNNLQTPLLTTYATGQPGCFNGTLCHAAVGHANDPQPWTNPANHGANQTGRQGAKFSIEACRSCHATTASGPNPLYTKPLGSMVAGCSSAGCHDQNVRLAHPYVWLPGRVAGITTDHRTARDLSASCGLCHGAALDGVGGVAPSCMGGMVFGAVTIRCHSNTTMATNPTYVQCTSCHTEPPSGPGGAASPNRAYAHPSHNYACTTCHGTSTAGTPTHADGTITIVLSSGTYNGPVARTCSNITCHGGAGSVTPQWTSTGNGCSICHNTPPDGNAPRGNSFPNVAGAHVIHTFTGVSCSACHNGAGSGTTLHGNGTVNVSINPVYQAETVSPGGSTASYNPGTGQCTNISCHGGLAFNPGNLTPAWNGGPANLTADCYNCHTIATNAIPALPAAYAPNLITPQYNSFWSGDGRARGHVFGNSYHALHLGLGNGAELDFSAFSLITCVDCHDTTLLAANHFTGLGTQAMTGADSTIIASFGYNAGNNWTCAAGIGCHGRADGTGNRTWK